MLCSTLHFHFSKHSTKECDETRKRPAFCRVASVHLFAGKAKAEKSSPKPAAKQKKNQEVGPEQDK